MNGIGRPLSISFGGESTKIWLLRVGHGQTVFACNASITGTERKSLLYCLPEVF